MLIEAVPVEVVDTTGAGDCLCGTLAARIAAGDTLDVALERAVAAASLSTTTPGAR
jgi:ribokinase